MEDFPTGTNENVFSSSSVYSASIKFRAYLLMSAPLKFNKFTPLSYVNTRVNLYTIICTTATYSQKVLRGVIFGTGGAAGCTAGSICFGTGGAGLP